MIAAGLTSSLIFRSFRSGGLRLRLWHRGGIELVRASCRGARLQAADISLESRPLLDRPEHQTPADLRSHVNGGGGELIAADIRSTRDGALERIDRLLVAAEIGRAH